MSLRDFIVIANGPFLPHAVIIEAIDHRSIIALDGAADKLLALDLIPDVILGDFDSIDPKTQKYWGITDNFVTMRDDAVPYLGRNGVKIVPAKDQSETDLVKAIRYCDAQEAEDIVIVCASYGRADLHEASLLALETEYQKERPITLYSEQQTLCWARDETVRISGAIGDYCGFVAQYPGHCATTGLCYPCEKTPVSLCNQLQETTASIVVTGQALLLLPPQLAAQRAFMQRSDTERLKTLWQEAAKVSAYFGTE